MSRVNFLMDLSRFIGSKITHDPQRWEQLNNRVMGKTAGPREIAYDIKIKDGPAHKLSKNWYFERDHRRAVVPDYVISAQKLIADGKTVSAGSLPPRPGKTLSPKDRTNEYYPDYAIKEIMSLENFGKTW